VAPDDRRNTSPPGHRCIPTDAGLWAGILGENAAEGIGSILKGHWAILGSHPESRTVRTIAGVSFTALSHPLVANKVRQLRDRTTSNADFLRLAGEISRFLAYEAFRDAPVTATTVATPVVDDAPAIRLDTEYVVVPILRAGLGMSPAVQEVLPRTRLCLVGLRRNEETLSPDVYLDGLPADLTGVHVVVCDPMLATGGSMVQVLDMLRSRGAIDITALVLIAAPEGVATVAAAHPHCRVFAAALDDHLNEVGYIVPGLGDAGDRLFGLPGR
jgi:uracil phosphoribosyltransferase